MIKFIKSVSLLILLSQAASPNLSLAASSTSFPSIEHTKLNITQVDLLKDLQSKAKASEQREALADMMDKAHLGFNPSAKPGEKARSRLGFEIGLNRNGYELSGIKKLIEQGALESDPASATRLLFLAQEYDDLELTKLLIEAGVDINVPDERGFTVLHRSIGYNHTDIALELIRNKADLKGLNDLKNTPLMEAAKQGNLEIVNALILAGADVNYVPENEYGDQGALYWAFRSGDQAVISALIDAGAVKGMDRDAIGNPKFDPAAPRQCSSSSKKCPDRTNWVKRSGPSCEFEACPKTEEVIVQEIVKGTFSEVDTKLSKDAIHILKDGTEEQKNKAIEEIKASPSKYNPAALLALSRVLFARIEDKDAVFWFLVADIRNRYDNFICKSENAAWRIGGFDNGVPQFKPYAGLNPDVMKELYEKALEWDELTPYEYDHRWVLIGTGMKGYKLTDPIPDQVCIPEENWEKSKLHNRDEYASAFRSYTNVFDYRAQPKAREEKILKPNFEKLLEKAEKGDDKAQYELATMNLTAGNKILIEGDEADFKEKWLRASADQNNVAAMHKLGQRYILGINVPKDKIEEKFEEGKKLLIAAGQKGSSSSFGTLGGNYLQKKQPIEAYAWFSLSEFIEQKLHPKLKMFPDKKSKMELELVLSQEELKAAQALAQEYIKKYGGDL